MPVANVSHIVKKEFRYAQDHSRRGRIPAALGLSYALTERQTAAPQAQKIAPRGAHRIERASSTRMRVVRQATGSAQAGCSASALRLGLSGERREPCEAKNNGHILTTLIASSLRASP